MKKKLLFIIFIIPICQIFSQVSLYPIKKASFGQNHHTNRDISYFSHIDSNKNLIIVGTTENDSTYTDVVTMKLDENYKLIWKKQFSIDTDLSFEIPLRSFLNSNNELYIIGGSLFRRSYGYGLIFLAKYSSDGNLLYKKTIGEVDGSGLIDFSYMDVGLNNDGTLSLVYNEFKLENFESSNIFNFLKIDNQGNTIGSFTKQIFHNSITGKIDSGIFYLLVKKDSQDNQNDNSYKLYKISGTGDETIIQFTDADFISYYNGVVLPYNVKLNIDSDKNCYLACSYISGNYSYAFDKIDITKINGYNEIEYHIYTSGSDNYYLIDSFINESKGYVVLANNLSTQSITFLTFDKNNGLTTVTNPENMLATGFKKNIDDTFFITTSNSNIRLFSKDLQELKSFNTSNTYELEDFSKMDDQSISVIGTSYEKMFPESDFYTQLDIHAEKIKGSQIENNYLFNGIGTSRAQPQDVIIDNDNNLLVFVEEQLGPEDLAIGGVDPPKSYRIIKYDQNLNVIWEVGIPKFIFEKKYFFDDANFLYVNLRDYNNGENYDLYRISPSGNVEFLNDSYNAHGFFGNESNIFIATYNVSNSVTNGNHFFIYKLDKKTGNLLDERKIESEKFLDFFTLDDDLYFYTGGGNLDKPNEINLYKNGEKIFTRKLPENYGLSVEEIDKDGTVLFTTANEGGFRINKIDINNSYTYFATQYRIIDAPTFKNNHVFLYLDADFTILLDQKLNFLSFGDNVNSYYPHLMNWGDYLLLSNRYENRIRIIDQSGKVINDFNTEIALHEMFIIKTDAQDHLILAGQHGNKYKVVLEFSNNEYSWYRGYIHKYESLEKVLGTSDVDLISEDSKITIYPNPTSGILNIHVQNQQIEKINLYNISGQLLKEFDDNHFDLKNFKSGIYFLKIFTDSDKIINSKIIKN